MIEAFIKKISNLFFLKNSIKKYNRYLKPGVYTLDSVINLAWRKDSKTVKFVEDKLVKNTYNLKHELCFKDLVKGILNPEKIIVKNQYQDIDFKGSVFFVSHNFDRDIKIFNVERKEVLTICENPDKFKKKILDINFFRPYFEIPCIKFFDFDKKIYIEEFVDSKDKNEWSQNDYEVVITDLFLSYINYYKSILIKHELVLGSISQKINWLKRDYILSNIGDMLETGISEELILIKFPLFSQHGDLWLPNILLRENEEQSICLIDWEESGEFIFFYDLFFLIGTEALHNNSNYLNKYLEGRYDTYMTELFRTVNMEFNQERRKSYFFLFLVEFLYKKMFNKTDKEKQKELREYTLLIKEIDKR